MRPLLKFIGKGLLILLLVAFSIKAVQTVCWRIEFPIVPAASLDSWDPTERVEAAWQAAKKYGGAKQ